MNKDEMKQLVDLNEELTRIQTNLESALEEISILAQKVNFLIENNSVPIYNSSESDDEELPDYYSTSIQDLGLKRATLNSLDSIEWYWEWDKKYSNPQQFAQVGDIALHLINQRIRYHRKTIIFLNDSCRMAYQFTEAQAIEICHKLEELGYCHENIDLILGRHEIWHWGIEPRTVRVLIGAGLHTKEQIAEIPDEQLL